MWNKNSESICIAAYEYAKKVMLTFRAGNLIPISVV